MIIKDSTRFIEMIKEANATTPEEKIAILEKFLARYSFEEWSKLGNDPEKILNDVRETTEIFCDQITARELRSVRSGHPFLEYSTIEDDNMLIFDEGKIFKDARSLVDEHRIFFNHEKDDEIDEIIRKTIGESVLTFRIEEETETTDPKRFLSVRTHSPGNFVAITAKIAQQTFLGDFSSDFGKNANVQSKKRQKKNPLGTRITIDPDGLKDHGVSINREPTPYDREIHDSVVSYAVSATGADDMFITDSMIFDVVSGKTDSTLTDKQKKDISDSMTKMMYSRIKIDASEEAREWGVDQFVYDGPLIPAERVTIIMNGKKTECYHLLRRPPLYDYANRLGQVRREEIRLLNTPVSKNTETITLQGYLFRRILAMDSNRRLSPNILYDSIYKVNDISKFTDKQIRKKKMSIRNTTKKILDYWKREGFIRDYHDYDKDGKIIGRDSSVVAVGIKIDLVDRREKLRG